MLKKSLILFSLSLLMLPAAFPQGRGGGKGQGSGRSQGQGQQMGGNRGQGQSQPGMQGGDSQMDRKRTHATQQQRDQIRDCDRLADGIRKQARKMARTSGSNFNPAEARQQQTQIREQIRLMEQEHERLANGLDASQHQAWQEQIRNMNQSRQQLILQHQQMDTELNGNPDPARIAARAKEMERTMENWRNQYRVLSSQTEE